MDVIFKIHIDFNEFSCALFPLYFQEPSKVSSMLQSIHQGLSKHKKVCFIPFCGAIKVFGAIKYLASLRQGSLDE